MSTITNFGSDAVTWLTLAGAVIIFLTAVRGLGKTLNTIIVDPNYANTFRQNPGSTLWKTLRPLVLPAILLTAFFVAHGYGDKFSATSGTTPGILINK